MNNYLLEGTDNLSINIEIDDIISKEKFTDTEKTNYDLEEISLLNVLEDLDTYNLLTPKKIIIVKGLDKVKKTTLEYNFDDALKHLYKYLKDPNPDNLLIIVVDKVNNKLNMYKELKKYCTYKEITVNSAGYIRDKLKDYKLEAGFINELITYSNNDMTKIANECEKLMNYKYNEKSLTKEDIHLLVTKEYGDSTNLTFDFVAALGEKNIKKALSLFKELEEYNPNILGLISLIEMQYRLMYQVKVLSDRKMTDKQIADTLNINSTYRIQKIRELTYYYSKEDISKFLIKLSDIDLKAKTTDLTPTSLIEDLIINL
ncbi:MAG: DNA polymerase III subunit delta [Bacilli bacterium]|nr:DNA polymerase III subunit delta [Bacilli bacterium]